MVFVMLGLGLFLLGAMAFAIDFGNIWFHRQAAQTAADAACTAGAMDLLLDATTNTTNKGGFTAQAPGNGFDCNNGANSGASPCVYAVKNSYASSVAVGSSAQGNNVYVSFVNAPPGVPTPSASIAPHPFMRVDVKDNMRTFFTGFLSGNTVQTVRAFAVCGVNVDTAPIPILVLHPTDPKSLDIQGGGGQSSNVQIIGGPKQSIQVNSCSASGATTPCGSNNAANIAGSGNVNLCQAGPGFCGASMGVFGAEPQPGNSAFTTSCGTNALCTGTQVAPKWSSPQTPISDPFAQTAAPTNFAAGTTPFVPTDLSAANSANNSAGPCTSADIAAGQCYVTYTTHGCADSGATAVPPTNNNGCQLFTPGYYPNGITIKKGVAVFDPGLYWVDNGMDLQSNSFVRPSFYAGTYTTTVPGWFGYKDAVTGKVDGGTIFYFHGTNTVTVSANSGKVSGGQNNPDTFGGNAYLQASANAAALVTCPNGGTIPTPALPATLNGNILLAPCSLSGTWSDPGTGSPFAAPFATDRGILFFQDRGNASTSGSPVQASWGGGGQFLLAGTMYFHQCHINAADTGTLCANTAPVAFNTQFTLSGNTGSTTYVLGEIITDELVIGGGGAIAMHLSPSTAFNILKASLYQ